MFTNSFLSFQIIFVRATTSLINHLCGENGLTYCLLENFVHVSLTDLFTLFLRTGFGPCEYYSYVKQKSILCINLLYECKLFLSCTVFQLLIPCRCSRGRAGHLGGEVEVRERGADPGQLHGPALQPRGQPHLVPERPSGTYVTSFTRLLLLESGTDGRNPIILVVSRRDTACLTSL